MEVVIVTVVRYRHAFAVLHGTRYTDDERRSVLEEQAKNNVYHKFIDGKAIIKQGFLDKRKVRY